MRKLHITMAICVLALGVAVAPAAIGKPGNKGPKGPKGPKQVSGVVTVSAAPNPVSSVTTVVASGNVKANSSCRKNRTVRFAYVNGVTGAVTPLAVVAETRSNGDYTAALPPPADAPGSAVAVQATVDETLRKKKLKGKRKGAGKGKKKGNSKRRKFNCAETTGTSTALTVVSP